MYFFVSFVSLTSMDANQLETLQRVAAMLIDVRSELEACEPHTPEMHEVHSTISRAHGLCWQIIHDHIEVQRNKDSRSRAAPG
jgi:hypothetical protein